jgi:hypothetical protein
MCFLLLLMKRMKLKKNNIGYTHPWSWMTLPFLILQYPLIQMKTMMTRLVMFMVLAKLKHRKRCYFCWRNNNIYRCHSYAGEHTASNFPRGGFQFSESYGTKAAPPGPNRTMTGSLWSETTGGAVANKHPETFRVLEYLTFTLQEAWDNGNIARNHNILSGQHRVECGV